MNREPYAHAPSNGNLANKTGQGGYTYGDPAHPHAVTATASSNNGYAYDANGNMTHRSIVNDGVYALTYDAENRLVSVTKSGFSASFVYNGDGTRIKTIINGVTTTFIGNWLEWKVGTETQVKYYYAGAQRIAMRTGAGTANSGLKWLIGDHLGSTSVTADYAGTLISRTLYKPLHSIQGRLWGEVRYQSGALPTKYTYTGQYSHTADFGLMYYVARWYDPVLGRFAQADTIVPGAGQPMAWDRYAYGLNNPSRYTDPSGHHYCDSQFADPEECENYQPDVPLTHTGDPIPGSDKTRGKGGDEVYALFREYQTTCGWWNNNCTTYFGLAKFLGMWIFFEGGHLSEMATVLATVLAQNLFVGGNNGPICNPQGCFNNAHAIFNFIGAYSLGGGGIFSGPHVAAIVNADLNHTVEGGMTNLIASLGAKALDPASVLSWDRDTGPSNWGNIKGALPGGNLAVPNGINGLGAGMVYYRNGTFVVYSKLQRDSLPNIDWRLTTDLD